MSTQALLDKISATAAAKVEEIERATADQVASIEAAAEAEAVAVTAAVAQRNEKDIAQLRRAILSKARQSGKLLVQTARREAFDEVLEAAYKQLVDEDPKRAELFTDKRAELEMYLAQQLR
ncbi:MAG TPA: hypothetical protein VKP88_01370 [Candidatus Paceibacterota bacterium]|nr:hypothetical protein [Candidatus Paceibacterota bacterium]